VIRNNEFIHDARINRIVDYNFNKILPKYLVGSIVKFGNTSILKFFNLNKKELAADNYDINVIKLVDDFFSENDKIILNVNNNISNNNNKDEKGNQIQNEKEVIDSGKNLGENQVAEIQGKDIKMSIDDVINNESIKTSVAGIDKNGLEFASCLKKSIDKKFLLLQINENGTCLSEFENLTNKEIDALFSKYKITNNFEKTDFILNTENQNFSEENNTKRIKQAINVQSEKIITLNPLKDNFESLMKNTINKFNGNILFIKS
jgi:hypothetical protein